MKTAVLFTVGIVVVTGCGQILPAVASGPLPIENGFRSRADKCRHVGEDDFTRQYLTADSQLAACPLNYDGLGLFVFETSANWETEVQGYVLLTVPKS